MLELFGFIFSGIFAVIGYFLYKFTNKNKLLGFLFAKNKSVYSYLKLGITPILLFSIVEKAKLINNEFIFAIKGLSILLFVFIFILFYYLIKIIIKKEMKIFTISLFYISLFISYISTFLLLNIIDLSFIIIILGYLSFFIILFSYFYEELAKPNFSIFSSKQE